MSRPVLWIPSIPSPSGSVTATRKTAWGKLREASSLSMLFSSLLAASRRAKVKSAALSKASVEIPSTLTSARVISSSKLSSNARVDSAFSAKAITSPSVGPYLRCSCFNSVNRSERLSSRTGSREIESRYFRRPPARSSNSNPAEVIRSASGPRLPSREVACSKFFRISTKALLTGSISCRLEAPTRRRSVSADLSCSRSRNSFSSSPATGLHLRISAS